MLLTGISIFILLLLSAFFSGSETGLTAASRSRLHNLKNEGSKRAGLALKLREQKERLIGAILLGNNAVNILASALATSLAIKLFDEDGVFYATALMTLLVLVFSEVLPKTYAFRNAERVALLVSPLVALLVRVLSPITLFVQVIVDAVLKAFGLGTGDSPLGSSADELRGAIDLHHTEGGVIKDDKYMLGGILDLNELEVGEIMVHRKTMEAINIDDPKERIIDQILSSHHTRIPVWQEKQDNVIGILHSKDALRALHECGNDLEKLCFKTILMPPWFIPETTTLRDQLRAFRERKSHFALVVDEYGDLLGIITLEDIIEEIVGQIEDEQDVVRQPWRQLPDGSYIISGSAALRDINRELDWDLPDEEANTIAGLIIHTAQAIPDIKQVFHFFGFRFEVLKKKRNQITMLKIKKLETPPEEEGQYTL